VILWAACPAGEAMPFRSRQAAVGAEGLGGGGGDPPVWPGAFRSRARWVSRVAVRPSRSDATKERP